MARVARHTAARTARPGKGAQHNGGSKEHGHLLPCPKGCLAKAASAVLQMLAGQIARFVPCSVLGALQLLPLQSKAHDVKPLNRLQELAQVC